MPAATRNVSSRSRQCNPTRVRRCLRIFFGHLFSNLGLFALVVGYVLLGALLFEFLEAGYELEQRGHIQQYREDCLKELWLITGKTASLCYSHGLYLGDRHVPRILPARQNI